MQSFTDQPNPSPQYSFGGFDPTKEFQPAKAIRVLVACELSGIVRDAFVEKSHDAWSCDLFPAEHNTNRGIQPLDTLNDGWGFLIVCAKNSLRYQTLAS